jgi:hypothetical protein
VERPSAAANELDGAIVKRAVLFTERGAIKEDLGMTRFQVEAEMAPRVERWLERAGHAVRREFETQWGICDLVGARFDHQRSKSRLAEVSTACIGPLARLEVLLAVGSHTSIPLRELERTCVEELGIDGFDDHLDELSRMGLVNVTDRAVRARRVSWLPTHTSLIAVELKLARIEEAFHQAFHNLQFARGSFVAMPFEVARKIVEGKWASRFEGAGVGVLAVTEVRCVVLLNARVRRSLMDKSLQMHVAERLWRWHVKDSASCTAARSAPGASKVR